MYTPKPTRLGHLVLKVRDVKKSVAFYEEVVGLSVSDWIDDRMCFMRAAEDHHDLALLQLPPDAVDRPEGEYASVEHFSYRVETVEEIFEITAMLQARGIDIDRGPGRHGPGDNTFIVFRDPDGHLVEFYSDMEQIPLDSDRTAAVWNSDELETFDQWELEKFVVEPPDRIKKLLS